MSAYTAMTDTARLALDWRHRALATLGEVVDGILDRDRRPADATRAPKADAHVPDHDFETWDRLPV